MKKTLNKPPVWNAPKTAMETITVTLKTITPMFGGGYEPGQVDMENPIRPASIRGHLRYWWRATAGASCRNAEELFQQESELWGRAASYDEKTGKTVGAGNVAIQVRVVNTGNEVQFRSLVAEKADSQTGTEVGYFLFPFDEQQENRDKDKEYRPARKGQSNVEFQLTVATSKEFALEVETAIRAWIAFGGVGARTRRGCGSLTVVSDNRDQWLPPTNRWEAWFQNLVPASAMNTSWTVLSGAAIYVGAPNDKKVPAYNRRDGGVKASNILKVWLDLAQFWAGVRKGHYTVKRPEYNPRNGGEWQDHELLRTLSPTADSAELAKPLLGLPLIYQKFDATKTHPPSFVGTLEADSSGRMASPIILKPVVFADGSISPLVAVLNAPVPKAIRIKERNQFLTLTKPQSDPVLQALGAGNALDAVKEAARKERWTEVQL